MSVVVTREMSARAMAEKSGSVRRLRPAYSAWGKSPSFQPRRR